MFRGSFNCRLLMLLCCCVALGVWPTSTFAQESDAKLDKAARSTVRGRILFADSEQPLRRATLLLRKEFNTRFQKRAVSGRRGEFTFQGISAGMYYIEIEAPGVVSRTTGQSLTEFGFSLEESTLPVVTVDGSNDVKTEIRATRGGAISGRISYGDGEPATNAQLVLYRQKGPTTILFFMRRGFFTDDRGVYRIEGLPAGQYFVGAVENNSGAGKTYPREGIGLVTAYHPAVTSVSAATMVTVQAGNETRDINIKFAEEPRRLSGTLKWKHGNAPVRHATVFVRRVGDPLAGVDYPRFLRTLTPTSGFDNVDLMVRDMFVLNLLSINSPYVEADDEGHWSLPDVPPGTYVVSVAAPVPVDDSEKLRSSKEKAAEFDRPDFSRGILRGKAEVTIRDKNVDDVTIELTAGGSVAGSIEIEGDASTEVALLTNANALGLESAYTTRADVQADGSFVIASVPAGTAWLDIYERRESHYYIRSMTGKGLNLLTEPLKLIEGEQVTGVQIVLGTDLATVDGTVVATSAGGSIAGAGVALLPVDQRKWNIRSTWGLARADAEGKFSMRLGPGEYFVFAWSLANEPTAALESYFRAQLPTARRITLQPNETKALTVQASTSREP